MGNADALSRLPVDQASREVTSSILLVDACELPITSKPIASQTKSDPILSKVLQCLTLKDKDVLSDQQ